MFEIEDLGELLAILLALLTGALLCSWRWFPRSGFSGGHGLARLDPVNGLRDLAGSRAASTRRFLQGLARWKPSSGNRSFDTHQRDARRRIDEDRKAFRQHRDEVERTREQAEFEAFIADRNTHSSWKE